MTKADSVGTLGVDLRTRIKRLGAKELQSDILGMGPCSGDGSRGKVQIEETDGSSSGQKECDLFVFVYGGIWPGSRRGAFLPWLPITGQKESGWENCIANKGMKQIQEVQMWRQVRGLAGAVMCKTRDLGKSGRIG